MTKKTTTRATLLLGVLLLAGVLGGCPSGDHDGHGSEHEAHDGHDDHEGHTDEHK